ncbi:hypothetical protein NC652_002931 [Populus alba x Populus x berolinensis]|uniref:Uncharacterized protein n=1 Tax=Populus alba x Populus x berolinensis TaxID=444605 RepID=A0AAD6WIL4_9ROSI|nr:hypothetical protein NC652_002931 [Populus alba x Populus x berolinensis]KAJ7013176.1 hypothetical protein NC653_003019 [Populus alba x Populus x berolinensis]
MPIMLVKKIIKMEISFRWVAACVSLQVAERVASIKQAAAMENNGVLIEKKFEGEMWWGLSSVFVDLEGGRFGSLQDKALPCVDWIVTTEKGLVACGTGFLKKGGD